jgi:hypothetical protein
MLDFGQREAMPMTEETVEQFLFRRERELMAKASALRGQLAPVEAELVKVQRMRAVLPAPNRPTNALSGLINQSDSNLPFKIAPASNALVTPTNPSITELVGATYANRTIKDLVIQALIDAFPHGAKIGQLRDFISDGYSRTVDPGSLRTQLHRLKAAGILGQDPSTDTWNFRDGKRGLYAMYDHPTSRRDMKELQDDNPEDDAQRFPWEGDGSTEKQAEPVSSSELFQTLKDKIKRDKS